MATTLEITERDVANALSAHTGPQYLAPYFGRDRSVAEAVEYLDEPMGKVHYWTRRWHDLGLLEVVARQERAGRAILRYRTVADKFVVPERLLPETLLERQLDRVNRRMLHNLQREFPEVAYEGELTVWLPPGQRGISIDRATSRRAEFAAKGGFQSSFVVNLEPHEAVELREELEQLRDRWLERAGGADRKAGEAGRRAQMVVLATAADGED